jgi:hypothetical protein
MSFPKVGAVILAGCVLSLISVAGCSSSSGDAGPSTGAAPTDPGGGPGDPSGGGGGTGGTGPVGKADLDALGAAYCAFYDRCSKGFVEEWFTDLATCTTRLGASREKTLTQPGVSISRTQLNACLSQLKTGACGVDTTACTFKGTSANGTPCYGPEQCASGECFYPVDPNTFASPACGTCKDLAPVNGDCSQADCASGSTCTNNVCTPDLGVGGACDDQNTFCPFELDCVAGQCVKPLAENADCTTGADSVPCDYHLTCTNGKCIQPTITFVGVGDACGVDEATGTSNRCRSSHCASKKCVAFVEAGQPCDETDLTQLCADGSSCRDGKCVADDPSACK